MPRGGRGSHSTSVPAPLTESALQARKSFYCELCSKGYSRMNEFEAHESSYDHQHKKRFMEMKQMQKGSTTAEARRERERRAEEKAGLITIKPITLGNSTQGKATKAFPTNSRAGSGDDSLVPAKKGFRSAFTAETIPADDAEKIKPVRGFKKAFTSADEQSSLADTLKSQNSPPEAPRSGFHENGDGDDDADVDEDDIFTLYDPSRPTS